MVLKLGALRRIDQKYLESFEMWCCKSWTDREMKFCIESRRREISYKQ